MPNNRKIWSVKSELLKKSREAAIAAVQIFNNPSISFKTELFIVTMMIAWTYLMHAYYRDQNVEYRYFKIVGTRRKFDKTNRGADKYWELERCINCETCPLSLDISNNLKFLIGLRHEIEHQMTTSVDHAVSAKLQACCLNYNNTIKQMFGNDFGVDRHLSVSLQFANISPEQVDDLREAQDLPDHISSYIETFESGLTVEEYKNQAYAYRVLFVPIFAKRPGQADKVVEFIKSDSPLAQEIERNYAVIKETEKKKYLPGQIVSMIKENGYPKFTMNDHTNLWQAMDAKNPQLNYGCLVANKNWHWYESWVNIVKEHCGKSKDKYK